jgi:hypothetical protein
MVSFGGNEAQAQTGVRRERKTCGECSFQHPTQEDGHHVSGSLIKNTEIVSLSEDVLNKEENVKDDPKDSVLTQVLISIFSILILTETLLFRWMKNNRALRL